MEFMCEKLDSHVYVDPNILSMTIATFLMLGNWCTLTSVQNIVGPLVQSSCAMVTDDCMSTSSSVNFPSSMEGTTCFALVDKSPSNATVNGSLTKTATSEGRTSPSNRPAKFIFSLAMKSVITSVICAGDEMNLRSAGKCSIRPVLKSVAKRSSLTGNARICSTRSMTVLSLPCSAKLRSFRCLNMSLRKQASAMKLSSSMRLKCVSAFLCLLLRRKVMISSLRPQKCSSALPLDSHLTSLCITLHVS